MRSLEILARQQMLKGKQELLNDSPLLRFFNRQLEKWDDARRRYQDLRNVKTRELSVGTSTMKVQWNPARIVSTGAKIDKQTLAERPCFLCEQNRPKEQVKKSIRPAGQSIPHIANTLHHTFGQARATAHPQVVWRNT